MSFDSQGEIGDVGIERGYMFDFTHVAPQAVQLPKALHCKCRAGRRLVHSETIVTSGGNELDKRFMQPRDCGVVNVTGSHNQHGSKSADEMLDVD